MILYHGSNLDIASINLNMCRPYKDFGRGFYLTSMEDQARKMAHRVSKIYGGPEIVNVYEIADDFLLQEGLHIQDFRMTITEEWAAFVMNNRNRKFTDIESKLCNLDCKYDIVTGPVANDDLAMLLREYQNHAISLDVLRSELSYKQTTNQYSFHTQRAVKLLRKAGVIYG